MNFDENEIDNCLLRNSFQIAKLDATTTLEYKTLLSKKYVGGRHFFDEESWVSAVSVDDSFGWRVSSKFNFTYPIILFTCFGEKNLIVAYKIDNYESLIGLLEDTYQYVYILTDIDASFLLMFNHHSYVIGSGDAINWILNAYKDSKVFTRI